MKRLLLLLFSFTLFAQDYGNDAEALELCTTLQSNSFSSDLDADNALDRILSVVGLSKNFVLSPCSDINNAVAVSYKGVRYILYDPEFMSMLSSNTSNWTNLFILAHEVGHHVNGHSLDLVLYAGDIVDAPELEKKRQQELEADEFAGFVLAKLGATLSQTTSSVSKLSNEDDTYSTHPKRDRRIAAITKGYKNYTREIRVVSSQKDYSSPVETISGDWKIETSSRAQLVNTDDFNSLNPFEKNERLKSIPIKSKTITAKGLSYDGNNKVSLVIDFEKWDNIYGLATWRLESYLNSGIDPSYLSKKHGTNIKISLKLDEELIPKFSFSREVLDLFEGFKKGEVNCKIKYLVDDKFEGALWGTFSNWYYRYKPFNINSIDMEEIYEYDFINIEDKYNLENAKQKYKFYAVKNEYEVITTKEEKANISLNEYISKWYVVCKPTAVQYHSDFDIKSEYPREDWDNNSLTEIYDFIDALKRGNMLYMKFDYNYLVSDGRTYSEMKSGYDIIPNKTFVIDLKGSSKALSF